MNLIILKLGGSIISQKDKQPVFRTKVVKRLVKEIKKAQEQLKFKLILIHGTGSFGHPPAHRYRLDEGIQADETKMGFSISKRQGYLLNNYLWEILEENALPAVTIPPFAITVSSDKKIVSMDLKIIKTLLSMNRVPILFGDEVIDKKQGYSICSSDQIAAYLASKLKPKLLLFATDVDGIYTANPKVHKQAKKIPAINVNNISEISNKMTPHNPLDVSGEMAGKLNFLRAFPLSPKTSIKIFSGLKPGKSYRALLGKNVGTEITQ